MSYIPINPGEVLSDASEIKYARIRAVERTYGLGRFSIFRLIKQGTIRSVLFKSSKKAKGYRLIDLRSLEDYLASRATGGTTK
jgi:hypothetical protein